MGKLIDGRISSRCNGQKPTPYLRKIMPLICCKYRPLNSYAIDLGCGNLRNSIYVHNQFKFEVTPYDMAGDYGNKLVLGRDRINEATNSVNLILCNYLLMFLTDDERVQTANEITRVAKRGCFLIVELYEAKTGLPYDEEKILGLFNDRGWECLHKEKNRFTVKKS